MNDHVETQHTGEVRMRKDDSVGQDFLKSIVVSEDEKTAVKVSLQKDLKKKRGARGTQTTTVIVRGKRKGGSTRNPVDDSGASGESSDGDRDGDDGDGEEEEEEEAQAREERVSCKECRFVITEIIKRRKRKNQND